MRREIRVLGFELQQSPRIYVAAIPGRWLLKHSTPSWRISDPEKGFQRVVREERARSIAITVLDQGRTFPNAIVLATDRTVIERTEGRLKLPTSLRFLVVDGQHRLWAQKFSEFEAYYACLVHTGLSEVDMAKLFLEINDNQKRVPASLRWDLVRLVRPEDDPFAVTASELVLELATERPSPLFQRIDLTGEQNEISLKQGSLAPEIKSLVSSRAGGLRHLDFEKQFSILATYLTAIKSLDADGWKTAQSPYGKARILRVLLRLLPVVVKKTGLKAEKVPVSAFRKILQRIDKSTLETDAIRAAQGSAGMKEILEVVRRQLKV